MGATDGVARANRRVRVPAVLAGQPGYLGALAAPNVEVLRHDARSDTFPEWSFELVHTRAVLMHIPDDMEAVAARLADPDFLGCGSVHIGVWGRRPAD